nr:DUF1349 domain-containing protein [uncultured Agathobaculum sp.]
MLPVFEKEHLFWLNQPVSYDIGAGGVRITTQPGTDLWQRTYYGFRNDNAPMLLVKTAEQYFSFTVRTDFDSKRRFDQCGVIVYQNSDNWLKASIEYENEVFQRLGSVVTNCGYSDWATTDIPAAERHMYYRLSRRGSDFCVESAQDGACYRQMRIAHLTEGANEIQVGIYACSPEQSSFEARFSEISFGPCQWQAHQ